MYSRVPSKRVAMVSKKVFCGAIRPRITGIRERVEPRLSRRSEPWFSAEVDTKPGRNLDVAPGAPPNPWRRAPSRDTRDSTVKKQTNTVQVIPAKRRREEPLEAGGERMEGRRDGGDGHIYARVYCNAIPLSSSPSRSSVAQTRFSLLCQPLSISLKFSLHLSPFHVLMNAYYKRPNQSVVPSLFGLLHHIHFFFCHVSQLELQNLSPPKNRKHIWVIMNMVIIILHVWNLQKQHMSMRICGFSTSYNLYIHYDANCYRDKADSLKWIKDFYLHESVCVGFLRLLQFPPTI